MINGEGLTQLCNRTDSVLLWNSIATVCFIIVGVITPLLTNSYKISFLAEMA